MISQAQLRRIHTALWSFWPKTVFSDWNIWM